MEERYQRLIEKAKQGFYELPHPDNLKEKAIKYLSLWLTNDIFVTYVHHIIHLINNKKWDLLLDSFFRTIPFGTGGRRGLVGVGPNRINLCTVKISAQGYSQYLIKNFGVLAYKRGIVLAYDVRKSKLDGFDKTNDSSLNVISSFQLAKCAANVYAANGIKVYMFKSFRSTPMLSFTIRELKAIAGCVFSASHNLPQYNGEKFYNYKGSQPIPPSDEAIFYEIKECINKVLEGKQRDVVNLIKYIGTEVESSYYNTVCNISMNNERNIKILYSPMHGTGLTSVFPILSQLGFDVVLDKETSNLSGNFENIFLNIPNPEFKQSFSNLVTNANLIKADIIISTDPDADRFGLMVLHEKNWEFLDGNQIGIILTEYIINNFKKYKNRLIIIKSEVTSSLIDYISKYNNITCIGNLLIGFKYICNIINDIEKIKSVFILGIEESNGYLIGDYCRDKDASGPAILISELAATLKKNNLTLINYINNIYSKYGYSYNYQTNITLVGIDGIKKIDLLMRFFRNNLNNYFGKFQIKSKIDRWNEDSQPHVSKSDSNARNMIIFVLEPLEKIKSIKLSIRPSGTEPKLKIYVEIITPAFDIINIDNIKINSKNIGSMIEKSFLKYCYSFSG